MLKSVNEMTNYMISATDGEIGRCRDFLFDGETWTIRYMVADTGKWLPGKKVLVAFAFLDAADWLNQELKVKLTKEQLENSPPLDKDAPVSRQYETEYFNYFSWPYYWSSADTLGATPYPPGVPVSLPQEVQQKYANPEESRLRSAKEVAGYHIRAQDGEVGHVEDYIVEEETWIIRYVVVDTRNWLPGRKVLIPPQWLSEIDWAGKKVQAILTSTEIKESPEYDPSQPVNREYEIQLYDYYGRPVYWSNP